METSYYGNTTLHPFGFFILLIMCLILVVVKRDKVGLPFAIISVFIPPGQRIVLAGFDFTFLRIVVLIGIIRVILRNEYKRIKLNNVDKSVLLWALVSTIAFWIQQNSVSGLINRLGYLFDTAGIYFFFRFVFRERKDIEGVFKSFILLSVPILFFFIIEKQTGYNTFSIFGGVPRFTLIREGRLRVQGAFAHPILAGCYWAALLPYLVSKLVLFKTVNIKILLQICVFGLLIILCASSTPIIGLLAGIGFLFMFNMRKYSKITPILFVVIYFILDLLMEKPVWHLISRIDISGGSTGWHRYWLINQAINYFNEWWLIGIRNIDHWNVYANDITNQYILEGIRGGVFSLIAFIMIYINATRITIIGCTALVENNYKKDAYFLWSLCACNLVHAVNFIAVSYFGQIILLQYLSLAMISSFSQIVASRYEK